MSETHVDHPGDVKWFAGYGPAKVIGPCPHLCEHWMTRTVAWGPDYEHYTLVQCDVADGCAGRCRGWTSEYPPYIEGPKFKLQPLLEVCPDPTSSEGDTR